MNFSQVLSSNFELSSLPFKGDNFRSAEVVSAEHTGCCIRSVCGTNAQLPCTIRQGGKIYRIQGKFTTIFIITTLQNVGYVMSEVAFALFSNIEPISLQHF